MIRKATKNDINTIENILYDAVIWLNQQGMENLWTYENTRWDYLSKSYDIDDFYICYCNGEAVACMALTNKDTQYWPDAVSDKSMYLHKLAVIRTASGKRISTLLIDYAKHIASNKGIPTIRLDCNAKREKLRKIYEREGFNLVKIVENTQGYQLALYEC